MAFCDIADICCLENWITGWGKRLNELKTALIGFAFIGYHIDEDGHKFGVP